MGLLFGFIIGEAYFNNIEEFNIVKMESILRQEQFIECQEQLNKLPTKQKESLSEWLENSLML